MPRLRVSEADGLLEKSGSLFCYAAFSRNNDFSIQGGGLQAVR